MSVINKDGDAEVVFTTTGKVLQGEGRIAPSAKEASLNGTVNLKAVVANELKIGAVITITITDEEADERLNS